METGGLKELRVLGVVGMTKNWYKVERSDLNGDSDVVLSKIISRAVLLLGKHCCTVSACSQL